MGASCRGSQQACQHTPYGDNSKKYISAGGLGKEFVKGSEAHKNSVTGDTVGDPLKDTSGPALNIVMKLTAIISLVFGSAIAGFSNADGGPFGCNEAEEPWAQFCSVLAAEAPCG